MRIHRKTRRPPRIPKLKVLEVVNDGEIKASELAERSGNHDVKVFAQNMIEAHRQSNTDATALARTLSFKSDDSQISDDLRKESKDDLQKLKTLKGAAFDKAYVNTLVGAHETALDTLNNTLIPSAKNAQLKKLLVDTRAVVESHLEHARELQTALNK